VRVTLTVFPDSPDAGDPGCICSLCGKSFTEPEHVGPYDDREFYEDEDADDAFPIRLFFNEGKDGEARFHTRCFNQIYTVKGKEFVAHDGVEIRWRKPGEVVPA